jgi:transposase-like protein
VIYPYFLCVGRHSKRTNCERSAMYVPDIEAAVEEYYRRIEISEHTVTALRELVISEFDQLHDIARRERHAYESERADLLDERGKLLQAHYAGAIPIDLLKTEQERISRRLAFLEVQIEAGDMEYDRAKAHLDDCLTLAGNCHTLYMSLDASLRRTTNQAFFDRLYVQDDNRIEGQVGEPFNIFFDPEIQKLALRREAEGESGTQTSSVARLNNGHLVALIDLCSSKYPTGVETENLRRIRGSLAASRTAGADTLPDDAQTSREAPMPRRKWKRLSDDARAQVVARYSAGDTTTALAKDYDVAKSTIIGILRANHVVVRRQPMTAQQVGDAARLYESGLSLSQVAEALSVNQETMRVAIIKAGVKIRPAT